MRSTTIIVPSHEEIYAFYKYLSGMRNLMESTIEEYMKWFKYIDVELIHNQEYIDAFLSQYGNTSIIRGMLLNLLEFKKLQRKVFLPKPSRVRKRKRIIRDVTRNEIEEIITMTKRENLRNGLMIEVMYFGALRLMEVATISLSSLKVKEWMKNPTRPCKLIVLGKGDKERVVFIPPSTTSEIIDIFAEKDMDFNAFANSTSPLFATIKGKPLDIDYIYKIIKEASYEVIGRDVRPHELRHARATELIRMGIDIKDLKIYLGHSELSTTEMYVHRKERESLDAIEKIIS